MMGAAMLFAASATAFGDSTDRPVYREARLIELRREALLTARSLQRGPERNQLRQVARSMGSLLRSVQWMEEHTLEELDEPEAARWSPA